jgi:hypothetical protein
MLPPILVTIHYRGHHDHSNAAWKVHAASKSEEYNKCICWGEPFVAFEGLWGFSIDQKHPEIKQAMDDGAQMMIEQRVRFEYTRYRTTGGLDHVWFERWEYLPILGEGQTAPDPHWGSESYAEFCGLFAYEEIRARAFPITKAAGADPAPVQVTRYKKGNLSRPAGGNPPDTGTQYTPPLEGQDGEVSQDLAYARLNSMTPWASAGSTYAPFHCFSPWYEIGTNLGPTPVPKKPRTPTPPGNRPGLVVTPPRGYVTDPDRDGPWY